MVSNEELLALKAENQRLIDLLELHGIEWRLSNSQQSLEQPSFQPTTQLSPSQKVALFRSLFRGRIDVYPIRWESHSTGKSGYTPACKNEWRAGVCEKPKVKCSECSNRQLSPVTDEVIYDHLAGKHTVGIYPLLTNDCCYFLAVDFDDEQWSEDATAFLVSCDDLGVSAYLEISRSGSGAHIWIFFDKAVTARDARRLGSAIISYTCNRTRQLTLTSYDRLFPNQDSMPKGGFGNLIALPLQKKPRESGFSLFVNKELQPYEDQWAFLATVSKMQIEDIEPVILRATGGSHPLDVTFIEEEDLNTPWQSPTTIQGKLTETMPAFLSVTLANQLYIEKVELPQSLSNRLIRLAAFQNPEFYKAQAMRFPVWDKPRIIGCAENFPKYLALPRGCLDAVQSLFQENGIHYELVDKRENGKKISAQFIGQLRLDQEIALAELLHHETGVLCAPTAFGKTVLAASLIAQRCVNTLILVHRTELLQQWRQRLETFLQTEKGDIGILGAGKKKLSGKIDIAVVQSLSRGGDVNPVVENYGQIIVDECHHLGASSFELLLKRVKAKYVLGLTATPFRRDGLQPIIFMQCGPIRYKASAPQGAPRDLSVNVYTLETKFDLPAEAGIQDVLGHLANDQTRIAFIVDKIRSAYSNGRKLLVLTERTEHLMQIHNALVNNVNVPELFLLHGRMSKKQRAELVSSLNALSDEKPRILLSTGKLVGEGFDHPVLDTLVLAMPISWRGNLQQYAGRLHREHALKTNVQIIDFVDATHPILLKMWNKRRIGYKAMGYELVSDEAI
ncbi:TOTE conflict system archaeo-eukaryotic primase domain-containing protein [Tolumonas lignilytica]|uniref:TOTE conflict system archaeo-eukaryotic primase domain-containing protein n=1 Tax=Tolumonas lignilytica TaxID=1283284 RepID=UPI000467D796|nr:DEAD/DEAH box helicase family protein [Tolumonas lignilytica]